MYTSNYRIKVIKTSSSCLVSLRDGSHAVDHQLWDLSLVGQEHRKRLRCWGELDLQHPGVPHVPPPGSVFHLLRSVSEPNQIAVNSLRLLLIRSGANTQRSFLSSYPTGWALTQPFPESRLCNCVVPSLLNQQWGSVSRATSQGLSGLFFPTLSPYRSRSLLRQEGSDLLLEADDRSIRLDGGSIPRLLICAAAPVSHRRLRRRKIGVGLSTWSGRKIEITEGRKSPESWGCLSLVRAFCLRGWKHGAMRFCPLAPAAVDEWGEILLSINRCKSRQWSRSPPEIFPHRSVFFLVSRRFLPLLQHGFVGFCFHLRLPAGDQSQAPGGDRSLVWEPALLLRRLRFRRRAPGGIHPCQRLKLPSIRQRRVRCGLEFELFDW